jgi:glucokinase
LKNLHDISVIGVDLGGTKILAGKVTADRVVKQFKELVPKQGTQDQVIEALCNAIDQVFDSHIAGIGIGVPSVVDVEKGIVYDVQNIPSWKEVHLKEILESKYGVPVYLNNDANCFAIGEKYFGKGKQYENFVALIVGTGMAAGLIINGKLFNGANCGAGEFGTIPYLEHNFEFYTSGQFFTNVYQVKGEDIFRLAQQGDQDALKMFDEFGSHFGNAIKTILYAVDPEVIILGGSVSQTFPFFEKSMRKGLTSFAYQKTITKLKFDISTNPDIAVLGAAALPLEALNIQKTLAVNSLRS